MNKQQLIARIAENAEVSQEVARRTLSATLKSITDALAGGDRVQLVGFGTFKVNDRAARKGRNPQTGDEIDIPASRAASFTAGTDLKEAINGR